MAAVRKLAPGRWTRIPRYLVFGGGFLYLASYVWVALYRLPYRFELEWMEGGCLEQVRRILEGKALYTAPRLEYIPYIYPPLYYYAAALTSRLIGDAGFLPLRLVSFLSSLVCFYLIFRIVQTQTGDRGGAFLSCFLFAATFRAGGGWLDVARVDSMFLALFLGGIYVISRGLSTSRCLAAGVWLSLACLTKQTAFLMSVPLVLYLLYRSWRRALAAVGPMILILGGAIALENRATDGWFSYYVLLLPGQHSWNRDVWISFWTRDLFPTVPIVLLIVAFSFFPFLGRHRGRIGPLWLAVAAGMIAGSYSTRVFEGGYENTLLPAFTILSVLVGFAFAAIRGWLAEQRPEGKSAGEAFIYLAIVLQLASGDLLYYPGQQVPTEWDLGAGARLVQMLRDTEGDVFVPSHPYIASFAGKRPSAPELAIREIQRSRTREKLELEKELAEAIRGQKYDLVLLDGRPSFLPEFDRYYVQARRVLQGPEFYPVTGAKRRPEFLYVPRRGGD